MLNGSLLCLVYDFKAEVAIGSIFCAPRREAALRSYADALRNDDLLKRHPEDYALISLGEINLETLEVELWKDPFKQGMMLDGRKEFAASEEVGSGSSAEGR